VNILIVDDERMPLEYLKRTVESVFPDSTAAAFRKPSEALEYVYSLEKSGEERIDVAFLDIEMGGMNGLQLAKSLKDIYGKTNIIFTTGYSQYAADAYAIHASGYLMKPVSAEAIIEAMEYLHHPIEPRLKKRVQIQTFGDFEVYADDKPLKFSRAKTKELFAYLVMRKGARCDNNEIVAALWENRPDSTALQSQFRHLVLDLRRTLRGVDAEDILIKQRGVLAIVTDKVSCDLYDFYNADTNAVNTYTGKFMAQYPWAEFKDAYLKKSSDNGINKQY